MRRRRRAAPSTAIRSPAAVEESVEESMSSAAGEDNDENRVRPDLGTLLWRFWKVAAPYWSSENKVQAGLWLAVVVVLTLGTTEDKDLRSNFSNCLGVLLEESGAYCCSLVVPCFRRLCEGNPFFKVILDDRLLAVVDLISFSNILYGIYLPLFIVLLIYSLGGTAISVFLGKDLVTLNFMPEKKESNFHYGLVEVQEDAESIVFYGGEEHEFQLMLGILERLLNI